MAGFAPLTDEVLIGLSPELGFMVKASNKINIIAKLFELKHRSTA
jgi:hypothetical protein